MRTTRRLAFLVALAAAVVAGAYVAGPVGATSSPSVDRQAWSASGPAAPPAPSSDEIYISVIAGHEQARSYLHIAPGDAPEASIAAGSVILTEASDGVMTDQAALAACSVTSAITASGQLSGPPPGVDCTTRTPLTRNADGTWTLPLGVFAHRLATGTALGLAIIPDLSTQTATFTVGFAIAKTSVEVPASASSVTIAQPSASGTATVTTPVKTTPSTVLPVTRDVATASTATIPANASPEGLVPSRPPTARPPQEGPVTPASHRRHAASPPAAVLVIPVAVAGLALLARSRWRAPVAVDPPMVSVSTLASTAVWLAVVIFALVASEATAYKLGFIAIVFIGAIGLHVLVNWTGELSLAHAGFIGLPAFAVAQASAHSGWSPILFVPLGVATGAVLGLIVAIAALRARGLQVALVTLAIAIAIGQFLFVRSWVIGPITGLRIPVPTLFGVQFNTAHALLPVLAVIVAIGVFASRAILDSKIGRALSMVRANPQAAAAAGIPVAMYRGLAYAMAGAFAGLAGSAYVLWVQRVSPKAFPLDLGFTYLVIAVLAGRGGLTALAVSAIFLEGGRLFSIIPQSLALYLGPIGLIYNVTRYQEGFNGVLRELSERLQHRKGRHHMAADTTAADRADIGRATESKRPAAVRLPVALAVLMLVAGFSALALAWYHAGNTDQIWIQNQEMLSGGVGGLGLIIVGCALLIRDALLHGKVLRSDEASLPPRFTAADTAADQPALLEG